VKAVHAADLVSARLQQAGEAESCATKVWVIRQYFLSGLQVDTTMIMRAHAALS